MAVGHGYAAAGGSRGRMRAADADRDRAVGFLTTAFTEGRLTKDEYEARVDSALSARTYSDLDVIVTDLPGARVIPPPPRMVTRTNPLAVASLACGVGQFFLGPIPTIPAIVLGHMARHQIRRSGEQGAGLALAGLFLGWAAVLLGILFIIGGAVAFTAFAHSGPAHFPPPPVHAQPGG
jgi:Domain of unknown function (DUF1707)/Domain of unknown function (DUF4190)